eukprot:13818-Heterococcus_DN1.PRE.2
MPDRGSDDERHSDSDEQAAPSSPGAEQQPLAWTLRDRLKQKKAALLERTGRAAGSEQASTRGAGGFAGASLAAKRERLRQQREDRQVEAEQAKSRLLRRRRRSDEAAGAGELAHTDEGGDDPAWDSGDSYSSADANADYGNNNNL